MLIPKKSKFDKNWLHRTRWKRPALELNPPNFAQSIFPYYSSFLHFFGKEFDRVFVVRGQMSAERYTERPFL